MFSCKLTVTKESGKSDLVTVAFSEEEGGFGSAFMEAIDKYGSQGADREARKSDPRIYSALAALREEEHRLGGELIRLCCPDSLPVAAALAHMLARQYQYVALFDPTANAYVIALGVSTERHALGEIID